ncbi:MAG: hypothetical protein DLM60_14940 [Pseudonocardiales bacterium]|nr:hypothetical protein [Actinomycetota bacterium]PZS16794.1 MAG: hypothetical protein DLM60_14940 [Pseudonocardiales bacterium]
MDSDVGRRGADGAADEIQLVIRPLGRPGDLGWVVKAHGEHYAAEFGWDTSFEALVARIVADYAGGHDPAREGAWIAELQAAGFELVKQQRHHSFGHDLLGQNWALSL